MSTRPAGAAKRPSRPEYLESLERGLKVLALFGTGGRHEFAMAEVADSLGMTRAAALRVLATLEHLGYVRSAGRAYTLTPLVLSLGYAYLSSLGFRALARPVAEALVIETGETCSIGVLDGADIVYVLRCEARRIIRIDLAAGSRIPAYLSSMGRVLLASLSKSELDAYLAALKPVAVTRRTVIGKPALKRIIAGARSTGWCYIEGELEESIAGMAVPVRNREGRTVAALNLSLVHSRYSQARIRRELLPRLLAASRRIEDIVSNEVAVA